jgi:hypothetical protein
MTEICYWKKICNTESREGIAFMRRFGIDYEKCRTKCDGEEKSITALECDKYITINEFIIKFIKRY